MNLPERKTIRLPEYDYSSPGAYFITICTRGKKNLFWDRQTMLNSAPTISTIVGQMKRWTSRQTGTSLWQKSFYEHVIRGERDYREIWEYIDHNPTRWVEDDYYTE